MPKLKNMLGATGFVEIPVPGDEPLIVHYRRASMTPRRQARLMGSIGPDGKPVVDAATLTAMCEIYADVIESWNLTDDQGNVIGTDAESLQDVDLATLNMVITAVGKEINPDPLSESDSSNGSSRAGVSEPLRIITAS